MYNEIVTHVQAIYWIDLIHANAIYHNKVRYWKLVSHCKTFCTIHKSVTDTPLYVTAAATINANYVKFKLDLLAFGSFMDEWACESAQNRCFIMCISVELAFYVYWAWYVLMQVDGPSDWLKYLPHLPLTQLKSILWLRAIPILAQFHYVWLSFFHVIPSQRMDVIFCSEIVGGWFQKSFGINSCNISKISPGKA